MKSYILSNRPACDALPYVFSATASVGRTELVPFFAATETEQVPFYELECYRAKQVCRPRPSYIPSATPAQRVRGLGEPPRGKSQARRVGRRNARSGISLMEILISIGVVSIGLLGVVMLIPVALIRLEQGALADRKAVYGRHAVREFRIRAMNSPGTLTEPNWLGPPGWQVGQSNLFLGALGEPPKREAYCLDPRLVARGWGADSNVRNLIQTFPYYGRTSARMWRISLRARGATTGLPLSAAVADEMFVLQDDLVFKIPDSNPELPPLQQFLVTQTGQPRKAYAEGKLSWMATIVPTPTSAGDTYILSIVVFNQRLIEPAEQAVAEEAVAQIVNSLGPGEITLRDVDGSGLAQPPSYSVKDIRQGDWLMVAQVASGQVLNATTGVQQVVKRPFFKWTRVIGADEKQGVPNVPREFTISLTDIYYDSTVPSFAVYVKGIVAVYEKTIRLENSTLWN